MGVVLDEVVTPIVPTNDWLGDQQSDPNDHLAGYSLSSDHLQGFSGEDTLIGAYGSDILEGGASSDVVLGDGTNSPTAVGDDDRLYGDSEIDTALAISQGNTQTGTGLKGDWLDGGDGDDALVGTTANDVLMGGRGADLLVGGAGDDELNGDDDYAPGNGAPWSVGDMPGNEFERLYNNIVRYNRADDFGTGDILYGGSAKWRALKQRRSTAAVGNRSCLS